MGITVNLGLPTNNSTTDRQKKFLTYTMEQDGNVSSANTIIDAWAGTVNQKITALENNKPTILLKPQWISVGYYEVITSEISEFKVDMLITVKLNKDNDGTLTMKVNELPIKSLLKYDTTGTLVNLSVGDLRKDREYQFRYDGTSFVWQGGTSADQLNIVGTVGNIVGIKSDNTVVDSGVSAAQVTISKNNITSLQTNKIDKTQIKNTLTETTSGNVLDATQGKVLNDAIGLKLAKTDVINTTTQSTTGKALDATQNNPDVTDTLANKIKVLQASDATQSQQINVLDGNKINNTCVTTDIFDNGKIGYTTSSTGTETLPSQGYIRHCISFTNGRSVDIAYGVFNNYGYNPSINFRTKHDTNISAWQQIATTTKTPFSCTANTGYTIISQYCYTINNYFVLTLQISKTDNTVFGTGDLTVATMPFSSGGLYIGGAMGSSDGTIWNLQANAYNSNANIVISTAQTTVKKITLTIQGVK